MGLLPVDGAEGVSLSALSKPSTGLESASRFPDGGDTGSFELIVGPSFKFMDDPDQFRRLPQLARQWT